MPAAGRLILALSSCLAAGARENGGHRTCKSMPRPKVNGGCTIETRPALNLYGDGLGQKP
jgi:hypothetical protein